MAEPFDPYYQWLGIPPKDQPPNHYRLLGVELFESNADVIERASDRQMSHVRTFQTGRYAQHSQRLLNELAAAKLCLLSSDNKRAYDERLGAEMGDGQHTIDDGSRDVLPPLAAPLIGNQPAGEASGNLFDFQPAIAGRQTSVDRLRRARQRPFWKQPVFKWLTAGTLAVLLIVALVTFLARERSRESRDKSREPENAIQQQ